MTKRRRKQEPDNRPHWSEDLTILYEGKEYTADQWQAMCNYAIRVGIEPNWSLDPTYNLKRK